jgi:AcrR family transcriptional regulator
MSSVKVSPGRPRSFDADQVLDKALEVFWQKGYEGASLPDLTQAMGINKPSLYAAFGNKEQLFLKAVERYENRPDAFFYPSLQQPTAYQVIERMLLGAAAAACNPDHPKGCVLVQSALSCSDDAMRVKQALSERRQAGAQLLADRLQQAQRDGDLPASTDANALARFVITVLQGISVQSSSGATADELLAVAKTALQAVPR